MQDRQAEWTTPTDVWIGSREHEAETLGARGSSRWLLEDGEPSGIVARPVDAIEREPDNLLVLASSRIDGRIKAVSAMTS